MDIAFPEGEKDRHSVKRHGAGRRPGHGLARLGRPVEHHRDGHAAVRPGGRGNADCDASNNTTTVQVTSAPPPAVGPEAACRGISWG